MKGDRLLGVNQITQKFWQAEILRKPSKIRGGGAWLKRSSAVKLGFLTRSPLMSLPRR
jgi:hypothetical protein